MPEAPLLLIVDDEPDFLEIFSAKFSAEGFRVETAHDGEDGIRKAKSLKPDLILMDVKMPGLSGVDAVLRLKDDPETKNIKVVFLTNLGDPREEMQAINRRLSTEVGAEGYLRKTDNLDALVDQVRAFLK
jgi:CheY-like chemotaxis protein